jgi:hypothetical protein
MNADTTDQEIAKNAKIAKIGNQNAFEMRRNRGSGGTRIFEGLKKTLLHPASEKIG